MAHIASAQLIKKQEAAEIEKLLNNLTIENRPATFIIRNANIITMKDSIILLNHDLLVEAGRIKKIGKNLEAPPSAKQIDASGMFVMPGLVDMHAHLFLQHPLTNTWILHLVLNGVTTVRDMNGSPEKLLFRDKITRNELLAPNIYQSSPLIDSRKDKFLEQVVSVDEARRVVKEAKLAGYDFIKIYDGLSSSIYDAILHESQLQKIPVVGHVPDEVSIDRVLNLKQNTIEHLTGYFEWNKSIVQVTNIADYAALTAASDTWNCPTIYNHFLNGSREGAAQVLADPVTKLIPQSVFELWSKRQSDHSEQVVEIVDKHGAANFHTLKGILAALYKAKAKLLIGTDAGNLPFLIPGYALHQEIDLMSTQIGIPTYEVLEMATIDAAVAMNKQDEFGTIEEGKRADIIFLNENPVQSLRTLRSPEGIMLRGIWISNSTRSKIMSEMKTIFGN